MESQETARILDKPFNGMDRLQESVRHGTSYMNLRSTEMYKVDPLVLKFLCISMNTWRTVLESGGIQFGEVNIRQGIFQGTSLSALLCIMPMIPLTSVLKKVPAGYTLKNKSKVSHALYMDDLKLFEKSKTYIVSLSAIRIFSDDMGMKFGIHTKCAVIV